METCVIAVEENQNDIVKAHSCFERTFSSMTVDDVYEIAKAVGAEVEKLIDSYGKSSVEGLVSHIVKVLELLESFAARNQAHKCKEEELLKAFETLQIQQQKKRHVKECDESSNSNVTESGDWHQKEKKLKETVEVLQSQVQQLKEENQELLARLQCTHSKEDRTQRQEREVMLKLKEVVDKQRDELRAKVQEISSMSKEVEALQEQQERLMKINAELRHKQNIIQTQLKSAVERRADLEADLCEKQKEIERLNSQLERASVHTAAETVTHINITLMLIGFRVFPKGIIRQKLVCSSCPSTGPNFRFGWLDEAYIGHICLHLSGKDMFVHNSPSAYKHFGTNIKFQH